MNKTQILDEIQKEIDWNLKITINHGSLSEVEYIFILSVCTVICKLKEKDR